MKTGQAGKTKTVKGFLSSEASESWARNRGAEGPGAVVGTSRIPRKGV